jgi:opacity protein-like surface antigen
MFRRLFFACCLIACCFSNAFAQKNELSIIAGGGRLSDGDSSVRASALTLAYTRSLPLGLAVEGSLDVFYVKNPPLASDDFGAAQIAVLYHFGSVSKSHRVIPYITAGAGKVSTDYTEIQSDPIYKFGGGVKYYFSDESPLGIRVEVRDEITRQGHQGYPLAGSRLSLVTLRVGVAYRF